MRPHFFLLTLLCTLTSCSTGRPVFAQRPDPPAESLFRDLSLRASFDANTEADFAIGSPSSPTAYRGGRGRVGNALQLNSREFVQFQSEVNLELGRGTLATWVRGNLAEVRNTTEPLSVVGGNLQLRLERPQGRLVFMTGRSLPGQDFQWDYACAVPADRIPAGRWTHLALTWDAASGDKRIFLNGEQVAVSQTQLIRSGSVPEPLRIGGPGIDAIDELMIWTRPLAAEEIRWLATDEARVAQAASRLPRPQKETPWPIYPELSHRDFEDAVLTLGETFEHRQVLVNTSDERRTAPVTFRLLDHREQPVGEPQSQRVTLGPGERTTITVPFKPDRTGIFKVEVAVEQAGVRRLRDTTSFAILPPGEPPTDRFFGGHINASGSIARASRKLGFASNRVHNMTQFTWWVRMEPQPNQFAMRGADQFRFLNSLGFDHLGQWFGTPHYATNDPEAQRGPRGPDDYPFRWVPNDEQALRRYVRESLNRFPEIKRWEMWNEPYVPIFWTGSPQQYAELCRIISDEARKVRPDVTLFIQVNHEGPWTKAAFDAGILDTCDGVAIHAYLGPNTEGAVSERHVNSIRELIAAKADRQFEIIHSEGAVGGSTFLRGLDYPEMPPESRRPPLDAVQAGGAYVRTRTVMRAMGVTQDYYYYFMHPQKVPPNESYSMFDVTQTPKPKAVAAAIMIRQLANASFVRRLDNVPTGVRVYEFERPDRRRVAVAWVEQGASLSFEQPMPALDLMGNPIPGGVRSLSFEPVYLVADGPVAQLADALQRGQAKAVAGDAARPGGEPVVPSPPFEVAAELGDRRLIPIPLREFVNRPLADTADGARRGWTGEGPFNDARMIVPGEHRWLGVPFVLPGEKPDDAAVVVFRGRTVRDGRERVVIPIGRNARGVFFAHASTWSGGQVGAYRVRYRDGQEVNLPVRVGDNIDDWWQPRRPGENSRVVEFRHPEPLEPAKPNRYLRVWYWENPRPNEPVASITAEPTGGSNFVLLGVTLAVW